MPAKTASKPKIAADASPAGNLPTGAAELAVALATPAPRGHLSIPALLWSQPGDGKSSFVESFHSAAFPVEVLIASIHDPTDFSGLPTLDHDRVHYFPPDWAMTFEEAGEGILFLDELSTAPPAVQAALLRVILERRVGGKALPPGVRIVAAANPPDVAAGGWELTPPLANRFVHIQWEQSGKIFADALLNGFATGTLPTLDLNKHAQRMSHWKATVAAFLRIQPALIRTKPADHECAFASPRTWDFAIRLLTSCEMLYPATKKNFATNKIMQNLLVGCIGSAAGKAFVGFLKNLNFPDADKVLDGLVAVEVKGMRDDDMFMLFSALARTLQERQEGDAIRFVNSALIFLALVDQVNALSRLDTIFAQLRQVAQSQLLQKVLEAAYQQKRQVELQQLLDRVFENTGLTEYVNLLESAHATK